jgi:hypothetical protein
MKPEHHIDAAIRQNAIYLVGIIRQFWVTKPVACLMIVGLVLISGWYLLDGRYTYRQSGSFTYRLDRLTGITCVKGSSHDWFNCN